MNRKFALALVLTGALCSAGAVAGGTAAAFSSEEIALIRDYYLLQGAPETDHGGKGKQAGKQASKGLPPGIAKNLARGKPLPPGIAKRQLPEDLNRRLPPVRSGYERAVVDGKVVLVEAASQVISDVLFDIAAN